MSRAFTATVVKDRRGRVLVPIPFDPDDAWGRRPQHHVNGTVNGMGVRTVVEPLGDAWGILLGPAWRRDCGVDAGDSVTVALMREGPQLEELPDDLRAAIDAQPSAREFWLSLAQFYQRAYLRWIDGTKRRPDLRAERIAAVVKWLDRGIKERPQP